MSRDEKENRILLLFRKSILFHDSWIFRIGKKLRDEGVAMVCLSMVFTGFVFDRMRQSLVLVTGLYLGNYEFCLMGKKDAKALTTVEITEKREIWIRPHVVVWHESFWKSFRFRLIWFFLEIGEVWNQTKYIVFHFY